jgi:hypothetical protein
MKHDTLCLEIVQTFAENSWGKEFGSIENIGKVNGIGIAIDP